MLCCIVFRRKLLIFYAFQTFHEYLKETINTPNNPFILYLIPVQEILYASVKFKTKVYSIHTTLRSPYQTPDKIYLSAHLLFQTSVYCTITHLETITEGLMVPGKNVNNKNVPSVAVVL